MPERIPPLETERLLIRELTMDDLPVLHAILNAAFDGDASLEARESWLQWTVRGYEMFAALEQPHYGERGVVLKETGELIGAVGIVPYVDRFPGVPALTPDPDGPATAEVGLFWAIDPAHQGNGYATEAAEVVVYYLERYLRLGRIVATTAPENAASQAVMRKIGMTIHHSGVPHPRVVGVRENRSRWRSHLFAVIPHPTAPRIWLRRWPSGWGLPRARVPRRIWHADTQRVVRHLHAQVGLQLWVRRLLHHEEDEAAKRSRSIYEVDVYGTSSSEDAASWEGAASPEEATSLVAASSGAGAWIGLGELASLSLREEKQRAILEHYLQALAGAASGEAIPSERAPWAARGWRETAARWVERELAALGHTVVAVEQVKQWVLSSVLRVRTDGPTFYFKTPVRLPLFVAEGTFTRRLAARFPEYVPAPVAVAPERGWMLFRDFETIFSWQTFLAERQAVLARMARLQRESADHVAALLADGALDRRLSLLAAQVDPLLADPHATAELSAEQLDKLRAHIPLL
ncbi:MAG: GNAT family N-acetyltransferase [Candidatus Promineifilaceae bacterium]|nr:GNAT family N-acetyltransferase [Candidatus Promineifilaceae bacterium]